MKFIGTEKAFTIQLTAGEINIIVNALNEHCADDVELGEEECELMEWLADLE
jgi:4-hydroxy-L-threonine phosphate dehydrogenase PdxA